MAFARHLAIYGLGGAASRLAAIVLVPLYTRALPQEAYGRLELLLALYALAILVVGVQGESALARDLHEARDKGWEDSLCSGALAMVGLGSAAVGLLGLAVWLAGAIPADLVRFLPLVVLAAIPAQIFALELLLLRFSGKATTYAVLAVVDLVASGLFSAALILGVRMGIAGALWGVIAGKLICVALSWPATFGRIGLRRPGREVLRRMLGYAAPTLPSVLLNWLQSTGTRVLLALFLSFVDVAIAGIAIKVGALYAIATYSVRLAWEPIAFRMLSADPPLADEFRAAWHLYAVLMLLVAGLTIAIAPVAVAVLAPPGYETALPLVGLFVMGQFWVGALTILTMGIHGARLTSRLTPVYLSGAIINVVAIAILAPLAGVAAAGVGSLVGALFSAWLSKHLSEAHFPLRFGNRLLCASGAASIALAGAGYAAFADAGRVGITAERMLVPMAGVALVSVALSVLVYLLGLHGEERARLKASLAPLAGWARAA
jgi:O-antigen/teichoic acid export membrane protein